MKERIEHYRASTAWQGKGFGWPQIAFAPPDEKGNAGGDDDNAGGDDNGDDQSGDDQGNGSDDAGGKKEPQSKVDGKGLFSKRTKAGDDNPDDKSGDDKTGKTADDGRPEGLADKFWDAKTKAVNADALAKAYTDLEKAHGTLKRTKSIGGEVPEDAGDYFKDGVTLPESVDRLAIQADDPGLKAWASVCKEEGIGKDLANRLMTKMFVNMNEFAAAPVDPEAEMAALGKNGPALVDGLFTWIDGMERAGEIASDDIDIVEQIMMTAKGARFLMKIRNQTGAKPIPVDPGTGRQGMSQDQWNEEYKAAVKAKDYKRQAELDKLGEGINGNEPGISGRAGGYNI